MKFSNNFSVMSLRVEGVTLDLAQGTMDWVQICEPLFLGFWAPFKILVQLALYIKNNRRKVYLNMCGDVRCKLESPFFYAFECRSKYMENKGRKVDLNMCGCVRSLTEEHKETMSLDLDFKHLQRVCLGKSYFNYYKLMSKPLKMAVKPHLSMSCLANGMITLLCSILH